MRLGLALRLLFVALAALLVAGCAREPVLLLATWTFEPPEGPSSEVTLPTHLPLPDRPARYVLRTRGVVPDDMRGRDLTLAFVRLPAIATLRADGHDAVALDPDVTTSYRVSGAQRWAIPRDRVGEDLALEPTLSHRFTQSAWIDCVPRLSATPHGDRTFLVVQRFNETTAIAGLAVVTLAGFSYLLVWLLDRRRTAHGWFALEALGGIAFPAFAAGVTQPVFGPADLMVMGLQVTLGAVCSVCFIHAYFPNDLRPLPLRGRALLLVWVGFCLFGLATLGPFTTTRWFAPLATAVVGASAWWQIGLFLKLRRKAPPPRNVFLVTLAWPIAGLLGTVEIAWWLGLGAPFQGLQGGSAAITIVAVLRIAALSREHLRAMRKTDRLNEELAARVALLEERNREVQRLNEELRRQIAARSAQLADALARIGARHSGVVVLDVDTTVAGRYRLVRPIASGGMGSVYEVERMVDGAAFALKVLHGRNEPLALARFAREAQIAAQLDHPHVVSIVDMDVDADGYVFLVMDLVRGTSVSELKDRYRDPSFVLPLLARVAEGLAAIHERGIVHRDLKPANVLVIDPDGDPQPKITDFGIALLDATGEREVDERADGARDAAAADEKTRVDRPGAEPVSAPSERPRASSPPPAPPSAGLTRTGVVMGTPLYMAPELLGGARLARPASDLYSFGVMAYLLVTGEHPFPERRDAASSSARDTVEPRPAASLASRSPLSAEVASVLDACLSIDPSKRPDAATVASVLGAAAAAHTRRAAPVAGPVAAQV